MAETKRSELEIATGIHARFINAYHEIKNPVKDGSANYGAFATLTEVLAQVKPVLEKHGLALVQENVSDDLGIGVHTVIYAEDGSLMDFGFCTYPLQKKDPQGAGSAITYARRYALKSIFALAEVDDDGDTASKAHDFVAELTTIREVAEDTGHKDALSSALGNPGSQKAALAIFSAMSEAERAKVAAVAAGTVEP
jgi:ERF superfamily